MPRANADEEDHYGVLGVKACASADEIKRAYRSLCLLHHPDKAAHLGDSARRDRERRMVALNVAYQVLMSPRQREEYDRVARPCSHPAAQPGQRFCAPKSARCGQNAPPAASRRESPAAGGERSEQAAGPAPQPGYQRPPAPSVPTVGPPQRRPRYQMGAKYTQRSRQARRMDPSQYTVHVDGRESEFAGAAPTAAQGARAASGAEATSGQPSSLPKPATWLQRKMDLAREWEQAHCPEPAEAEAYQWRRACDGWLNRIRERRQMQSPSGRNLSGSADDAFPEGYGDYHHDGHSPSHAAAAA